MDLWGAPVRPLAIDHRAAEAEPFPPASSVIGRLAVKRTLGRGKNAAEKSVPRNHGFDGSCRGMPMRFVCYEPLVTAEYVPQSLPPDPRSLGHGMGHAL
jgi:hypothetical protein